MPRTPPAALGEAHVLVLHLGPGSGGRMILSTYGFADADAVEERWSRFVAARYEDVTRD